MFELDLRSRKPIYEQLVDKVKELILYGVLKPDEQLPSVRALSMQCNVNPNTIQKAYRELEREGYIYSLPGKGSFISVLQDRSLEIKRGDIRKELLRLMTEAAYLGFTEEDMARLFREAKSKERKEDSHD